MKTKTVKAIAKGMLLGAALIAVAVITGCATAPLPGPNPLDEPGESEATVSDLHRGNIREITGNPTL